MALIRRCHLPGAGIDLAWREQRSDSTATKIRAFRRQEKRLTSPPTHTHTHTHTQTQSQKEQSVRVHACSYGLSAQIWCDEAPHVEGDWERKTMESAGRGGERRGEHQADKNTV